MEAAADAESTADGEATADAESAGSVGSREARESAGSAENREPAEPAGAEERTGSAEERTGSAEATEGGKSAGSETGRVTPLRIQLDDDEPGGEDEEALRRLLHRAVDELEPSPASLDHLRRAVPARRARRRQALVGAAAALVLGCAAVPALVHVATTSDSSSDRPANAASSHRPPEASGGPHGEGSGGKDADGPADKVEEHKGDKGKDKEKDKPSKGEEGGSGGTVPDPTNTLNATSPTCSRAQLTSGGAGSVGAADAEGRVYGSFRVVNISDRACTVEGSGSVGASAQGGADASRILVVDHTAGDAAAGLPDPSTQPGTLILKPGQAYEVKFAWIPAAGGGTSGCSTTGTPTPDPSTDGAQEGPQDDPSTGDPGGTPGGGGGGGGGGEPQDASVLVSHSPEAGDPAAASVSIGGACAGTIYRTGLLTS
ncbi:DUF4232 domain-containing protein [Streptomyces rugosispiralis]|uniref:DUF4232 domain-containing protein n=1 Tax=Streptomyces rugosispiralis TaxID=2967341 RepID=A0ABT1V0M2_9ACTN|nr:DUF4232 domain-containing protein [Streptomyces rugosispiralis]MCQ8190852.1 hypothetical protein [Streptomyces rugosispiralis]